MKKDKWPIGSIEWFNTAIARIKHIGEFLRDNDLNQSKDFVNAWGEQLFDDSEMLLGWFKEYRPDNEIWIHVDDRLPGEYKTVKAFAPSEGLEFHAWYVLDSNGNPKWQHCYPYTGQLEVSHWRKAVKPS